MIEDEKKYSAGAVKHSFWFSEFRKVINLLNKGKTFDEIKDLNINENIFAAPTQARGGQIFNTVSNRVKSLNQSFYQLFDRSDISTQKIIALIAILKSDDLFFDFVYEVYRDKLILGVNELADSDVRIFFKNKQLQSEQIAQWKDYTLKRLGTYYKTMLIEAGILDHGTEKRKILRPIIDKELEECLKANGMKSMILALTGVR